MLFSVDTEHKEKSENKPANADGTEEKKE
jgi:hypothetical protein